MGVSIQRRKMWMAAVCAALLLAWPQPAPAYNISIFTDNEVPSENLKPFPKWTGMLDRYFGQRSSFKPAECGNTQFNPCTLNDWRRFLVSVKKKPLLEQLKDINAYANEHPYIVDPINWGMKDYWATPYEFNVKDGDCEDYAIAKYISLRANGIPNDKMRIMIVQDQNLGGIIHAVLVVKEGEESWVLDNQIKQVIPASKIYHYRPIYSINETGWWLHKGGS